MLGAILSSFGFISVRSIKASAETIYTSGKRHFLACQAIKKYFNLLAPSDIYGDCDRLHKSAQFYPRTCKFSIFREKIGNSLSIS